MRVEDGQNNLMDDIRLPLQKEKKENVQEGLQKILDIERQLEDCMTNMMVLFQRKE